MPQTDQSHPGERGESGPRAEPGDGATALMPEVYDELRRLAAKYFAHQSASHTLQPTALVHEAYMRLADQDPSAWKDRAHFMAIAATAMRQILVDHARRRGAAKRGGGAPRLMLDEALAADPQEEFELLALDAALSRLAELDERKARVIELRFFTGLTIEETAEVIGVSHMTVSKDWRMARAWIAREMGADADE